MLSATNPVIIEVQISGLSLLNTDGNRAAINTACPIASTICCQCIFASIAQASHKGKLTQGSFRVPPAVTKDAVQELP